MGYGLLIFGVLLLLCVAAGSGDKKQVNNQGNTSPSSPHPKLTVGESHEVIVKEAPDPDGEPLSKFSCNIAGLSYHRDNLKLGGFVGYAYPETWNMYDPNAIAICNCYVKLMGYVPAKAQEEYFSFYPDKSPAIVVGHISCNVDGKLSGKAYFVRVHSWEYAQKEIESLAIWMRTKKNIVTFWGYDEVMRNIDEKIRAKSTENDTNITDSAASV